MTEKVKAGIQADIDLNFAGAQKDNVVVATIYTCNLQLLKQTINLSVLVGELSGSEADALSEILTAKLKSLGLPYK